MSEHKVSWQTNTVSRLRDGTREIGTEWHHRFVSKEDLNRVVTKLRHNGYTVKVDNKEG